MKYAEWNPKQQRLADKAIRLSDDFTAKLWDPMCRTLRIVVAGRKMMIALEAFNDALNIKPAQAKAKRLKRKHIA